MSKKLVSKIMAELLVAAAVVPAKGEALDDYAKKMCAVIQDLPEKEWDKLSPKAQDYFNDVATALNKKKSAPEPPDAQWEDEEEAQSSGRTRTRVRASDEGGSEAATQQAQYKPKRKDVVELKTSRGRVVTGTIVEVDDKEVVLDVGGKDEDFDLGRLEYIKLAGDGPGADAGGGAADDGPPQVGDTLQITTKRGKVSVGVVQQIDDTEVVIKTVSGEVEDYAIDRLDKMEVKVRGKAAAKDTKDTKPAEEGKTTRSRATTESGVPATVRLRELIILNRKASKEEIIKLAAKEKLDVKDNTAGLTYAEVHKVLDLLDKHKMLA